MPKTSKPSGMLLTVKNKEKSKKGVKQMCESCKNSKEKKYNYCYHCGKLLQEKRAAYLSQIEEFTRDWDLQNTIFDYLEMREKIKKPATAFALKLILKKLEKYPVNEQKTMLEQSILHNWVDVYEVKQEQKVIFEYKNSNPKGGIKIIENKTDYNEIYNF